MRKLSSKKKLKKVKGKSEEDSSHQESGSESAEANENGGNNEEASGSESGSRAAKRKTKKQAKYKETDDEAEASENADKEEEEANGDEEEYEVQEIIDDKVEKGITYFLIRWKGWGPDGDTWEAEDTLSCPDIVAKYKKKGKKSAASPKKPAAASKKPAPKGKKRKADEPPGDPDKEWEVERIIDVGYEKGARLFKVRWKGYRATFDTWEPEEHLNCEDLVQKFMKKVENVGNRELREAPKKTQRLSGDSYRRGSKRNSGKTRTVYYEEDE